MGCFTCLIIAGIGWGISFNLDTSLNRIPAGQGQYFEKLLANIDSESKPSFWNLDLAYRLEADFAGRSKIKFKSISKQPFVKNQAFEWASQTKLLTAILIEFFRLEGKVLVEDSIEKTFPDLSGSAVGKVTILELLNHTSGLPSQLLLVPTAAQFLGAIKPLSLENKGTYRYSDLGYAILGAIVGKLHGKPFESAVQDKIFSKLSLTESVLVESPLDLSRSPFKQRLLLGHDLKGNAVEHLSWGSFTAAGGWVGSIEDFAKFLEFIVRPSSQVLPEQVLLHQAARNCASQVLGWDFSKGDGWVVKYGDSNGFKSYVAMNLIQSKWFVLVVNSVSQELDSLITHDFW